MTAGLRRIATAIGLDRKIMSPLAVAALLRVLLMLAAFALTGTQVMTQGDTASYLEPGRNLILHGAFTNGGLPELDRTPGYPLFCMIAGMAPGNVLVTVIAQILLSLASLLLVRKVADRVFPTRNAGIVAAWLFAIEPLSIVYTSRLMPETLFVLLLLVAIERLLAFELSASLPTLLTAGVFLAAATFVRPAGYYLGFAIALGLALAGSRQRRLGWKAPATLLLGLMPWLAAWQLRNYVEAGYSGFSSVVEKNLYFFQSAEVTAELQHISLRTEQNKLGYPDEASYLVIHPEQQQWSQSQRLHFMRAQAIEILSAHPSLYLKSHIAGMFIVAFTPCATELLQLVGAYPTGDQAMPQRIVNESVATSIQRIIELHPVVAITMALFESYLLLLYGLAIRGSLSNGRAVLPGLTLIAIAAYFLIISGGAQAVGRYRSPIMPELCVLAAGSFASMRKKEKRGHDSPAQ